MKSLLILLSTILISSCGSINIHDTKACSVAGKVSAGANCVTALSGVKSQLSFDELIDLLESGAIIVPVNDFVNMKGDLEAACVRIKCNKKVKKKINDAFNRIIKNVAD